MNIKKIVAIVGISALPLFVMGEGCAPTTTKPDKYAHVQCKTDGLKKVWIFSKPKPGRYFTCGSEKCAVEFRTSTGKRVAYFPQNPTWINIPSGFKNFKMSGCGKWYRKQV